MSKAFDVRTGCFALVCATPFVAAALAGIRPLRIDGIHQTIGIVFALIVAFSVWRLGWRTPDRERSDRTDLAIAGALLVAPFLLMGSLWVGLGTPWDATVAENEMRYLVLMAMAVVETSGGMLAAHALASAGERTCAPLVSAALALAGPVYLVWGVLMFAAYSARAASDVLPAVFSSLDEATDVLLFVAGALTYAAGLLMALSMARVHWLGRMGARAFAIVSGVALVLLVHRGLAFLAPGEIGVPWYAAPGFIVGIPAIPFIVPALLGALLLRRAGTS